MDENGFEVVGEYKKSRAAPVSNPGTGAVAAFPGTVIFILLGQNI